MTLKILAVNASPLCRRHFLAYGARDHAAEAALSCAHDSPKSSATIQRSHKASLLQKMANDLAQVRVPHHWFAHFYVLSLAMSLFWLVQVLINGSLVQLLASQCDPVAPRMSSQQVYIVLVLMVIQSVRRLYESLKVSSRSDSSMWVGHWLVGLAFYSGINIAVWIEGARRSSRLGMTWEVWLTCKRCHTIFLSFGDHQTVFLAQLEGLCGCSFLSRGIWYPVLGPLVSFETQKVLAT